MIVAFEELPSEKQNKNQLARYCGAGPSSATDWFSGKTKNPSAKALPKLAEYLGVEVTQKRFVEEEALPKDAKVIDTTWQYVNKNGNPDKRFKDNKELPVVVYEEIVFRSNSGLNKRIQLSQTDLGKHFSGAITNLAIDANN